MRLRALLVVVLCAAAALLGLAACGGEAGRPALDEGGRAAEADAASFDYEAFFSGALTDTLRGNAGFGSVVATEAREERFVIVLKSREDPLGGLVFVRPTGAPLAPGTYDLASDFRLVYREGMQRALRATAGTLTLRVVRDTLIEGSFRADLAGTVAQPGQLPRESLADVRGSFRAEDGSVGFLLGL